MSDTPLSEFLGEQPNEVEQTEADGQPRDEHGRFASKTGEEAPAEQVSDPEASVTPTPEPQEERIPIAALKDERQKRQQLEERLRQYDDYFAQLQANQQPTEAPDMFADPEAHQAYVIEQAVSKALEKLQPTIQQGQTLTRAEVSEMLARQKFEDYDATVEVFKEALATNPFLLSQLQQAPDPATFAYNAGKQWEAAKSLGSTAPPSREQIEAEIREKLVAELGLNRPKAPSTLAGDRSVGSRSGPEWAGPTPLSHMLG